MVYDTYFSFDVNISEMNMYISNKKETSLATSVHCKQVLKKT